MSCPSSIRRQDSNPRPLDCEPPPITRAPAQVSTNVAQGPPLFQVQFHPKISALPIFNEHNEFL